MGCQYSKVSPIDGSTNQHVSNTDSANTHNKNDPIISQKGIADDDVFISNLISNDNHIPIVIADSQAFNNTFIQQRQQAIDNPFYRSAIDSCQPKSLQQLTDTIKLFSMEKSMIDTHWLIFYWIIRNIQYDTAAYVNGIHNDQSPEKVFQKRKSVSRGYANLYKYLCDQLNLPCQIITGYAKGYEFENRIDAPNEIDHTWNAVEIEHHWYLIESAWGAGYLNEDIIFQHEPNFYYFLPRSDEMIYHHLPTDEKWQLLSPPIKMEQYLEIPHLHPLFFNLNIEIISPRNQSHVDLIPDKSYALIIIKAPSDVHLMVDLILNDRAIDDGSYVLYDKHQQIYRCYFAPKKIGRHKICIYGKRGNVIGGEYKSVVDFILDVKHKPQNPLSFPKVWKVFSEFELEVLSPQNTYLIKLNNGDKHTEILIKTAVDIELRGRLLNEQKQEVTDGTQVYYDRRKHVWRCKFAPNRKGIFEAVIMAKKNTDPDIYTPAVAFKIEVNHISSPPTSYPYTWQLFHDLDLKIESPRNRSSVVWSNDASYAVILMEASNDVYLSCDIKYDNVKIENGSFAQFNHEKKLWQLVFAPERTGQHELIVYAKKNHDKASSLYPVVKFDLDVRKMPRAMKFPTIYTKFLTEKCQIYTPIQGILKKDSMAPIHCILPGARSVNVTVDAQLLNNEGYKRPILYREVKVGSKEVIIYARYGENKSFDSMIKYTVQ